MKAEFDQNLIYGILHFLYKNLNVKIEYKM